MSKFTESLSLNLSDTLSCNLKLLTYLLEGSGATVLKAETKLNNLLFSGSQGMENVAKLFSEKRVGCAIGRRGRVVILNEISEMAVTMLSAVDLLKTNSESALNVNIEQALQTVQLLNIALGRQMPHVSDSTRRVWYEDSVAKIKAAGKTAAEKSEKESEKQ